MINKLRIIIISSETILNYLIKSLLLIIRIRELREKEYILIK